MVEMEILDLISSWNTRTENLVNLSIELETKHNQPSVVCTHWKVQDLPTLLISKLFEVVVTVSSQRQTFFGFKHP